MKKIATALVLSLALAAVPSVHAEEARYVPRLGDIMTLIQIRHVKLWFAGNAQNWELAAFELQEIGEGFEDVAKFHPEEEGVSMGPMVDTLSKGDLAALGKAIEAKDRTRFRTGYDRLITSCNGCHQATKHAFIVIQRPKAPPLSNQVYTPASTRGTKSKSAR
jgi:cytochrome c553